MKDEIKHYADLKIKIKQLEDEASELQPKILEYIVGSGADEVEIDGVGKISLAHRKKWVYSDKVTQMEQALKDEKVLEEQIGTAQCTENPYILFKQER